MTINPIEAAKSTTPFWMLEIAHFDGVEIHPCRVETIEGDTTFIEQCEPKEAEFWSVYGHCKEGGVECVEDFEEYTEALIFSQKLLDAYPHLQTFGLLDCG